MNIMKKKIFTLLVLLVAAVSGAWADAVPAYNLSVEASKHGTGTVKFFVNSKEVTGANEGDMVTMTVTPDAGWIVDKAKVSATTYGNWEAAGARRNVQGDVPFLGDVTLTAVETAENTFTFTMPAANVKVKAEYLKISTLTFDPADKTNLMEVKVGDETVTPDQEGKLTEILEGLPVKLTAKQGYKFRKVEVKKKEEAVLIESFSIQTSKNTVYSGETFTCSIVDILPANATNQTFEWKIKTGAPAGTTIQSTSADTKSVTIQVGTVSSAASFTIEVTAKDGSGATKIKHLMVAPVM